MTEMNENERYIMESINLLRTQVVMKPSKVLFAIIDELYGRCNRIWVEGIKERMEIGKKWVNNPKKKPIKSIWIN